MSEGKVSVSIRMPKELNRKLQETAEAEDRSMNGQIVRLIRIGMQIEASRQQAAA